jgi:hypothetical protein
MDIPLALKERVRYCVRTGDDEEDDGDEDDDDDDDDDDSDVCWAMHRSSADGTLGSNVSVVSSNVLLGSIAVHVPMLCI